MTPITDRLDRFEDRLHSLENELAELRRLAADQAAPDAPPVVSQIFAPTPAPMAAPAAPQPAARSQAQRPRRSPRPEFDLSTLLGARALAWSGGALTLLGILFFFVLAVERGWIGPAARVGLGAA